MKISNHISTSRSSLQKPKSNQQGVALISVLLVVVIATVIAVSMIQEQKASITATMSFVERTQTVQYALGGEELGRQILFEDFAEGNARDFLTETWADPELHFDFEDGEVNLKITDLQGRINVNGLANNSKQQQIIRQRLINLLGAFGGDPALVDRIQDWMDEDNNSRPNGAEDFGYMGLDIPYRTSGQLMIDASEIVLTGIETEIYQVLREHLVALPEVDSALNINTASAAVYQSLTPGLTLDVAQTLAERRDEQEGFETVEAFLQTPELAGLGVTVNALSVQSSFFEIRVIARYQQRFAYLTSIVHRDITTGAMRVLKRDFSRNFRPNQQKVDP